MHWGRIHRVKDLPWLVWGQLFHGFGVLFLGIYSPFFLHLRTAAPLWGSDVVHCVWVPLTGTTVAEFLACGSLVGNWFLYIFPRYVQYRGHWRHLYYCYVMGLRPGNVAHVISLILWLIM